MLEQLLLLLLPPLWSLVLIAFLLPFKILRLGRLVVCSVALRRKLGLSVLRMKLLVGML